MDPQEARDDVFTRRFIAFFAVVLVAFSGAYFWQVTFGIVPKDNQGYANIILGFLVGTVVATPIAYWMGRSKTPPVNSASAPPAEPAVTSKEN